MLSVVDNAIEIDFGTGGIEGDAGTDGADGYYALSFTPPASQGIGVDARLLPAAGRRERRRRRSMRTT